MSYAAGKFMRLSGGKLKEKVLISSSFSKYFIPKLAVVSCVYYGTML